jgi:hypothetical protein
MLEAEIDVFSGMPNPTFQLSDKEEKELVDRILAEPAQLSPVMDETERCGLGYCGLIIRQIKTDAGAWSKAQSPKGLRTPKMIAARPDALPLECRLGTKSVRGESTADWLLKISERKRLAISDDVREVLQQGVQRVPSTRDAEEGPPEGEFEVDESRAAEMAPRGANWWNCGSALYTANVQYFNQPTVVNLNNCYCFASNHLANSRYALPGRRGGRPATSITCGGVIDGLRADGWIDGCQLNTLTIALVIWPNADYHFYRVVTGAPEWWWGHKRGAWPAVYTENQSTNNRALKQPLSPSNCDRGQYIHFCGYFYQNSATALVA